MRVLLLTTALLTLLPGLHAQDKKAGSSIFIELPWRYLIGSHADGKWLDSETTGKRLKAPKTEYRVFTLKGETGKTVGGKASPEMDLCPDVWLQKLTPEPDPDERTHAVGISASWNPLPRAIKIQDPTQEVYIKAMQEVLTGKGLAASKVKLTQLLRVDLDGDGKEEVLSTSTRYSNPEGLISPRAGDHSLITLRQVVNEKVQTQIVTGEFYVKGDESAAPNTFEIIGLLDLDGDGTLEIIVQTAYYEGGGMEVWKLTKTKLELVLSFGCGA